VAVFDGMFHDAVAEGRGLKAAKVRSDFGQGRMVLAAEAVRRGMADRIGTMEQTLNRFGASLAGGSPRASAQEARAEKRMAARRFLRRAQLVRP
jgi:ClpP class serine protease